MTIIRPAIELPAVLRRAMEAYRAGDPVTIAESFEQNARLITQLDPKLARRLGLEDVQTPVLATGAMGIMHFYAAELAAFDVAHFDVLSSLKVGRDVAAVCEWVLKLRGSDVEVYGRCHNIWTMDHTGRKCVDARNVCKIIQPDWDHSIN